MVYWKLILRSVCCLVIFVEVGGYVYVENESNKPDDNISDNAFFAKGRSYRIRNRNSNMYMSEGITQQLKHPIEQWPLGTPDNRTGQAWFVIPLEEDSYLIVNKRLRQSITEKFNDKQYHQHSVLSIPTFLPGAAETWTIQQVPSSTAERFFHIRNKVTTLSLIVGSRSKLEGYPIHHWPLEYDNDPAQQWAFEVEDQFPDTVNRSVADVGHIPTVTGWQQPISSKTDEVLIGQLAIPFPLIADPVLSRSRQSNLSPFYFLRRYGYWQAVTYHRHSGTSPVTMATNVTLGLITNNAKTMGVIAGLCVTAESSLCLKGSKLMLVIEELANGLKINVDEDFTAMTSKTMLLNRQYVSLNGQVNVVWFREDRYVLERLNGVKVLDWITRVPITISDSYRAHQLSAAFSSSK